MGQAGHKKSWQIFFCPSELWLVIIFLSLFLRPPESQSQPQGPAAKSAVNADRQAPGGDSAKSDCLADRPAPGGDSTHKPLSPKFHARLPALPTGRSAAASSTFAAIGPAADGVYNYPTASASSEPPSVFAAFGPDAAGVYNYPTASASSEASTSFGAVGPDAAGVYNYPTVSACSQAASISAPSPSSPLGIGPTADGVYNYPTNGAAERSGCPGSGGGAHGAKTSGGGDASTAPYEDEDVDGFNHVEVAAAQLQQIAATLGGAGGVGLDSSVVGGGVGSLKCSFCTKIFRGKSSLVNHERTHRAGPNFMCQYCRCQFPSKPGLIAHQQRHTANSNVTPYECVTCAQLFASKTQVRQLRHYFRPFLARASLLCTNLHALCDVLYSVPMLVGC